MKRNIAGRAVLLILSAALLSSSIGCTRTVTGGTTELNQDEEVNAIVSQLKDADETAEVYSQYAMADRKVSLILEGYTDEATMMQLADLLAQRGVDAVFFLSGEAVSDHENVVNYISDAGLEIGNYGLTGAKNMENNSPEKNARQLYKTQQFIAQATGTYPTLLRCNGSEYTTQLLTIADLCGISGAVEPTIYLNHVSFADYKNAVNFVHKMSRGSIISIKLGQVLDDTEYIQDEEPDQSPADDPSPNITDETPQKTPLSEYENIVNVVEWLLDALEEEDYQIVSLQELRDSKMTLSQEPAELDEATLAMLNADNYTIPVTEEPFGLPESEIAAESYFENTVFVGDSVTAKLKSYVENMRLTDPTFMEGAQFLTSTGLGVGSALWQVSEDSDHPTYNGEKMTIEDAVSRMDVRKVYIMLGVNDIGSYDVDTFIENYMMLIYLIKSESPDAEIYIESITPGIEGRSNPPTNGEIFAYDLALAKFCLEYGYHYVDVAYGLRDSGGYLPLEYCSDADSMGLHFTDAACGIWVNYLITHTG